ncbi:MAG: tRNA (adenosine(37)-N6)-threonylcarbamoyltransferase complex transferase subunit TsaD [Hyphomicrobiaceae bacterium]|nr:tRNA (adenosine(37)-N6)-threonylcarbamoyltransferase complex transferase subunit TsaD [Hyphomicrobiaceae bacterium]
MTSNVLPPADGPVLILGIETSCDETAAAVVRRDCDGAGFIMSNVVRSQWEQHRAFGGVVPEIAARAHVECLDDIIRLALAQAGVRLCDLDAIAATAGPGLIGGLLIGLTTGKALAHAAGLPLVAVNHLEAHALSAGLTDGARPPYLMLLVSGGHTQTLLIEDVGQYRRLGTTIDDALGEAFDKTAKLLGLGFPGGPAVEAAAKSGDPRRFAFPRPLAGRADANFSFAGLKTAVRRQAQLLAPLTDEDVADLCASFQSAVAGSVLDRVRRAYEMALATTSGVRLPLVAAGGVAANAALRQALAGLADELGTRLIVPAPALCTDNGAMIAWAGAERFVRGYRDGLEVGARARWPLDETANPILGAGKHGAKA